MNLVSLQCKRLGKYFANWVAQTKDLTLEEMRESKMVAVMHVCGDHTLCGNGKYDWCLPMKSK